MTLTVVDMTSCYETFQTDLRDIKVMTDFDFLGQWIFGEYFLNMLCTSPE